MALVEQRVDVPFEGGLDTERDRKKVIPSKLLELQNARFTGGSIEMRAGSSLLGDGVAATGATLTEALALDVAGGELLRWTAGGVYGRAAATAAPWVRRATETDARPLSYQLQAVAQRPYSTEVYDCASVGGVTLYVWTEGQAAGQLSARWVLRASVVDDATGVRYQDAVVVAEATPANPEPLEANRWRLLPRALVVGNSLVVVYGAANGNTVAGLLCRKLDPTNPSTFGPEVDISLGLQVRLGFEYPFEYAVVDATVDVSSPRFLVTYGDFSGNLTSVYVSVPVVGPPVLLPTTGSFTPPGGASNYNTPHLTRLADGSAFFLAFRNTADSTARLYRLDASTLAATQTATLFSGTGPFQLTTLEETPGTTTAWLQSVGAAPIQVLQWNAAGVVTVAAMVWARGVVLAGHAFLMGGPGGTVRTYVPCLYLDFFTSPIGLLATGVQPTLFVLEGNVTRTPRVVARFLAGESGAPITGPYIPHTVPTPEGAALLVARRQRVEFQESNGVAFDITPNGLARVEVREEEPGALLRVAENGTLHLGGAAPAYYDGAQWVEDGFHVAPEGLRVAGSGSGSLSAGRYSWVVCWEWTDAKGRLHRSAPSIPVSLTVLVGGRVELFIPYLHLTTKRGVRLALFRTVANGTVYYRVGTTRSARIQPDPGTSLADGVTFFDGSADAELVDNEVLYSTGPEGGTVGGELWHRPPPAYRATVLHRGYLFTTMLDDSSLVAYTLPLTEGEGPAWADELRLRVPAAHGAVVGFGSLDDKLVCFCERGAYAVLGTGPNRAGGDNGLTEPQYLTGSLGCVDARSIVPTPDGLLFQAPSGIHLLTRGLETVKLGAGVEAFNALEVVRGVEVPEAKEARFYTREGTTLVYSYEWRQWATWTGQPARDAALFNGALHLADGQRVRYEDDTVQTEAGQPYSVVVGSAWLSWAGFQGLQRVWRALLLGTSEVTTHLKAEAFYDWQEGTPGTTNEATFQGSSVGGPAAFQVSQHLTRQLCNTVRFRWTLTPAPSGAEDRGRVGLSALTLVFGVHRAHAKRNQRSV